MNMCAVLIVHHVIICHCRYSSKLHDWILNMLVVNAVERPYINWVQERTKDLLDKAENRVFTCF